VLWLGPRQLGFAPADLRSWRVSSPVLGTISRHQRSPGPARSDARQSVVPDL